MDLFKNLKRNLSCKINCNFLGTDMAKRHCKGKPEWKAHRRACNRVKQASGVAKHWKEGEKAAGKKL